MISEETLKEWEELCEKATEPKNATIRQVSDFFQAQSLLSEVGIKAMPQLLSRVRELEKEVAWLIENKNDKCSHLYSDCPMGMKCSDCWREQIDRSVHKIFNR